MSEANHHTVSGLPHKEFNPMYNTGLYISLKNIDESKWMRTLHPEAGVPLFLFTAMEALKDCIMEREDDTAKSYINLIVNTNIRYPTPPNSECRICQLVNYLLKKCENLDEAKEILMKEDTIIVFEVNRELWTRIHPKPLYVTKSFLKYAESIDYPMALLEEEFRYPLSLHRTYQYELLRKRFYLHEWRNGLSYLTYFALKNKRENYAKTAGYILANMMILTMHQLSEFFKDDLSVEEPHYILEKMRLYPRSHDILLKVSKVVGMAICELELEGISDYQPISAYDVRESDWYKSKVTNCISTMMCLNNYLAFKPEWPIRFSFYHIPDCETQPELCFCRFPNFLQRAHNFLEIRYQKINYIR